MPFTPFHFGPGALLHAVAPRQVSFLSFCAANVLIDLESLDNRFTTGTRHAMKLHARAPRHGGHVSRSLETAAFMAPPGSGVASCHVEGDAPMPGRQAVMQNGAVQVPGNAGSTMASQHMREVRLRIQPVGLGRSNETVKRGRSFAPSV